MSLKVLEEFEQWLENDLKYWERYPSVVNDERQDALKEVHEKLCELKTKHGLN